MNHRRQNRSSARRAVSALTQAGVVVLAMAVFSMTAIFQVGCGSEEEPGTTVTVEQPTPAGPKTFEFGTVKKTPHFETSTPAAGSVLPAAPINIVIDFNFDLGPGSKISIKKDGVEYGTVPEELAVIGDSDSQIDDGKLALRRGVNTQAPDGIYEVTYDACWPDGSCHDGRFEFAIDRSLLQTFTDMRNRAEVAVAMSDISFRPASIRISPGTKVTWTNGDTLEHFVNTDSHPAHTYFPQQNSRGLAAGASFSVTFMQRGAYPYHCSAHAAQMTGMIVVE